MGEVQASDVHTSIEHLDEHIDIPASGSEGANDLGFASSHIDGLEHLRKSDVSRVSGFVSLSRFDH